MKLLLLFLPLSLLADSVDHLRGEEVPASEVEGLPPGQQRMTFKPPQLSDEEERSPHIPAYLACDACTAIATQVELALWRTQKSAGMKNRLKHWQVIEVLEEACQINSYKDYGLTDHNGKHRLRGPGLDEKIGQGGVSAMGGKWPVRLSTICESIIGDFEDAEMEVYNRWQSKQPLQEFLCKNEDSPELSRCVRPEEQPENLVRNEIEEMLKNVPPKPKTKSQAKEEL